MFSLFLRQKILMFRNSLTPGYLVRRLPFITLGAGLWLLLYFGTCRVLLYLITTGTFGEILSQKLLSLIMSGIAVFLLISNVITALSSFYLSGDISFLRARPVETEDILKLKSFESAVLSSWTAALFTTPVLVAYGASYHAPALYYAVSSFAFLLLILMAGGMGMTAAHLLAGVFPARRSREFLLGLGLLIFLASYFAVKSGLPEGFGSPQDFLKTFTLFRMDTPFFPGYWVTKTFLPMIRGRTPDFLFMALLLGISTLLLFAAYLTGKRFYTRNVEKLGPSGEGRGPLRELPYPRPVTAVFFKDTRIFFRDSGQWLQILIISALVAVYIYDFMSLPLSALMALYPFAREVLVMVNLFMAGLVLTAVAARFLFTAVSFEGRAFWVVRTAPVSFKRFLWSKFLHGFVPLTAIVALLVSVTNGVLKVDGPLLLLSEGTALLLCISLCGLAAGLGAAFPKFEYENIASVAVGIGAMTFMLIALGLVTVTLSSAAWCYYACAARIREWGFHTVAIIPAAICIVSILFINAATFYLPMRAGIRRLETMQF